MVKENKEFNTLSLFNGFGCVWQALELAGINSNTKYSSEIEKYPNQANDLLYPETIQLGDVRNVDVSKLKPIHFLAGGSPCQSFSFAGKRKGMSTKEDNIEILTLEHYLELKSESFEFEGQSYLFWEYIRILTDIKKYNPDVIFLLENVIMGSKWQKILTRAIGINPKKINASLVSAQNRERLFWTNINAEQDGLFGDLKCMIPQPKDEGILLKDVLEKPEDFKSKKEYNNYMKKYFLSEKMIKYLNSRKANFNNGKINYKNENDVASCLNASTGLDISDNIIVEPNRKAKCFTAGGNSGGLHSQMELIVHNTMPRSSKTGKGGTGPLSRTDGKTYCLDTENTNAIEIFGCDFRTDEGIRVRQNGKSGTLQARARNDESCGQLAMVNKTIRRLTPRETERLQCVKDDYTKFGLERKILIQWEKNVELRNVTQISSVKKMNSVTNITYDILDTEQSISREKRLKKEKSVKWSYAIDSNQHLTAYVLCTLREFKEQEILNLKTELIPLIKNVSIAITKSENQEQRECVQSIIKCKESIQIRYTLNAKEKNQMFTDTLDILVELECIESLCLNTLEEALKATKKSIILIWLEQITKSLIFTYANQNKSISISINNLEISSNQELKSRIYILKTENIVKLSDSARYKMLGNGWCIKVVAHIFKYLKHPNLA